MATFVDFQDERVRELTEARKHVVPIGKNLFILLFNLSVENRIRKSCQIDRYRCICCVGRSSLPKHRSTTKFLMLNKEPNGTLPSASPPAVQLLCDGPASEKLNHYNTRTTLPLAVATLCREMNNYMFQSERLTTRSQHLRRRCPLHCIVDS